MKIAYVSQPIDYTGAHAQGSSIALWTDRAIRALQPRGAAFRVYAKHFADQPAYETIDGIEFRRFSTRLDEVIAKPFKLAERVQDYPCRKWPYFASALNYAGYAWQIAADLRRSPVDIVHIHNFSQLVGPIHTLNPRTKIILHMHCEWLTQLNDAKIVRRLQAVNQIVGCSDFITGTIKQRFPRLSARCQAIYNGVDTQLFSADDQSDTPAQSEPDGAYRILYVGRISPEKGLHVLLEAFQKVADACPQARLDLVGAPGSAPYEFITLISDDPQVNGLTRYYHGTQRRSDYFSELKASLPAHLANKITFTGSLSHADLAQRYRSADLLVNPSLSEAFGMSLIEAMASGLPVIAARTGGMVEIVQPGQTGLLVKPNDANELAQAILRLLAAPALRERMGAASRNRAFERYRWDCIADSLWKTYTSLTRTHAKT